MPDLYTLISDMIRKCRSGEKPEAMFRRDKPFSTIRHELFLQLRSKRFEEDYVVIKKLGEGSFGLVYQVVQKALGLRRALKIVRNTSNDIYSTREEIDVLTRMDHPNVLKLYQYYEVKDYFYIITELFDGKELIGELVAENSFTEAKASEIATEILKALMYTHSKNIAHRDLKAENLLVHKDNGKWVIKVIDWGLGAIVGKQQLHRKCGTPEYAAPEIFQGNYNEQCDMWSLGVMVFVMLSGEHPFKGANFGQTMHRVINEDPDFSGELWTKISEQAKDLIKKLLVKNPKERLTAQQAMSHPWFQLCQQGIVEPVNLNATLEKLKDFRITNSLTLAAMNYINNCLSTEQERRQLSEIFQYLDKNNDGVLSFEQLVEGYTGLQSRAIAENIVDDIFSKIDLNRNGKLQYNEFVTYAMLSRKAIQESKLKVAFQLFDLNGDNRISIEQTMDVPFAIMQVLFNGMEDLDESIVLRIITDMDENEDGYIDENEFIKFLSNLSRESEYSPDSTTLSFLSGDSRSITIRSETPSAKGSADYRFDKESTACIQTQGSEHSTSEPARFEANGNTNSAQIEVEEEKVVQTGRKLQQDVKHTRYRETKVRAHPQVKRVQQRSHNTRAIAKRL